MNANRGCRARFSPFFAAAGFVLLRSFANPAELCQTTLSPIPKKLKQLSCRCYLKKKSQKLPMKTKLK